MEKGEAVTPIGRLPRILNVTGEVAPEVTVAIAVSTPPGAPGVMVRVAGETARVTKQHCPTTNVKVVV